MTKFKVGDKVKFTSAEKHKESPGFYPQVETIGTIINVDCAGAWIQWPEGSTSGDDRWYTAFARIKGVDSPADRPKIIITHDGTTTRGWGGWEIKQYLDIRPTAATTYSVNVAPGEPGRPTSHEKREQA